MARLRIHGIEIEGVMSGAGMVPIPPDTTAQSISFPDTDGTYGFGTTATSGGKVLINIPGAGTMLALQSGGSNRMTFQASGGNNIMDGGSANYYAYANMHIFTGSGGSNEKMRLDTNHACSIGSGANAATGSILDLTSTTKGFLPPRMTGTQRDAISSPPSGLIIYNTTTGKINVRGASAWEAVTSV